MGGRSWLATYLGLAVIWGLSFALIKQGLTALTPIQVTACRMGFGALAVVVVLAVTGGLPRPTFSEWRTLAVLGIEGLAVPFALIAFAETRVTSILAGLLNAATPLFTAIFVSLMIPTERPRRIQVVGLVLGFVGIGVLIGAWDLSGTGVDPVGVLAMLAATVCYGFGVTYGRIALSDTRLAGVQLTAGQLVAGAGFLILLLPFDPGTPPGPLSATAVVSVLALGVVGTGLAMAMFWHVLREAGATVASTVTYVIPLVSTSVGVVMLREGLIWHQIVGGLVVIGGVILTQWPQLTGRGVAATPDRHAAVPD